MKSPHVSQIECDVLGKIIGCEWSGKKEEKWKELNMETKVLLIDTKREMFFPFFLFVLSVLLLNKEICATTKSVCVCVCYANKETLFERVKRKLQRNVESS